MSWIMVDVESDGPCPGLYSMTEVGAILVQEDLANAPTFYGQFCPISDNYMQEALDVCKRTRDETLGFPDPREVMTQFEQWLQEHAGDRPMFISDNNGFDYQWVCYYFYKMLGHNPFGHSSTNLGSLYKGLIGNTFKNFKHLRKTRHTHHPVDDARGNAEAMLHMKNEMGLKIKL